MQVDAKPNLRLELVAGKVHITSNDHDNFRYKQRVQKSTVPVLELDTPIPTNNVNTRYSV